MKLAMDFGSERARGRGVTAVLLEMQIPGFMLQQSPPQGGEAIYPILRPESFPDPDRPDVRLFLIRVGIFEPGSDAVSRLPESALRPTSIR